jgi:hypothetical protein
MRWYEDRESNEADHLQTAKLALEHRSNEKMDAKLHNTFFYGQEGTVELGPVTTPTVLQTDSDYFRNRALAEFNADLSETAGIRVAYQNDFYDYDQDGAGPDPRCLIAWSIWERWKDSGISGRTHPHCLATSIAR